MKKIALISFLVLLLACEKTQEEIAVSSVSISQKTTEMIIGETVQLTASVQPSNAADKTVCWASSKQSVASINENGLVSAIAEGAAIITATAGGKSATCTIIVSKGIIAISSITLDKESLELVEGETAVLTATLIPDDATDKTVRWSSSDSSVATVDDGKISAIKEGEATITAKAGDKTAGCKVIVVKRVIAVTSIELNKTTLELREGESEALIATVKPDDATDKTVTWSTSDASIAEVNNGEVTAKTEGDAIITATANDGSGVSASCAVSVKNPCPAGAVDLGLSVYWARCNLCESGFNHSQDVYGDYYAWGETETKSNYSWSTYKFWKSGHHLDNNLKLSKYNTNNSYGTVDNKTVLEPTDDVAHVKLGGKWRIPTDAEWMELLENCTWTWLGGMAGWGELVLTSKINGNSISLPAKGSRSSTTLYHDGSYGYYWSSSLYTDYPVEAWSVTFGSGSVYRYHFPRDYGLSVRPVSD